MRAHTFFVVALALACGGPTNVVKENQNTFQPWAIAASGSFVYWIDLLDDNVGRAATDGSSNGVLATNQANVSSIAVDDVNVYWTTRGSDAQAQCTSFPRCFSSDGGVFEMPLAGGTPIALATGLCGAGSIAVDANNVYVAVAGNGSVLEIPITGGTPLIHTVAELGLGTVAVDATSVYWTSLSSDFEKVMVSRSPIGAPNPIVITPPLENVVGSSGCGLARRTLAVDGANVYFPVIDLSQISSGFEPLTLMKSPASGGTPTALTVMALINANEYVGQLTIDATSAYFYDPELQELRRASLADGTTTTITRVDIAPEDIAVFGKNIFWSNSTEGIIQTTSL